MKKIIPIIILFFVNVVLGFSQSSIHYYGWNPQYSHSPSDVIQTQDGGFLIMGDVYSSQPLIENYVFKQYLVKINTSGDTLWTRYHNHDSYGGANIIETPSNNFVAYGEISGGYVCGAIGTTVPYTNYSLQTFSSTGDSLSLNKYNDQCNNNIKDMIKTSGALTALMNMTDINSNSTYAVKEISSNGIINTIPLPSNYVLQIEKTNNGYWLASSSTLYKVSFNGSALWQKQMTFSPSITDFCKINNDSLLFVRSSNDAAYGDTAIVEKTDSIGNKAWAKMYHLRANHVMYHSNGNYILTGILGTDLVVLALNNNGDSVWCKKYSLAMPAFGIKTIETSNGGIATLAYSGGYGLASQYALVLDSLNLITTIKENNGSQNINVYPNPFSDNTTFTIKSNNFNEKYSFELVDVLGKKVKLMAEINTKQFQISRDGLQNGIYFYKIYSAESVIGIGKFVIQ